MVDSWFTAVGVVLFEAWAVATDMAMAIWTVEGREVVRQLLDKAVDKGEVARD
jgi:hypothetical protein